MTLWYRCHRTNNPQSVFSGDGGLFVAGRWNHLGRKVIYCSESIALSTIEWLSHNGLSVSGFTYYRYSIDIPDVQVLYTSIAQLPSQWSSTPASDLSRDFSDVRLFTSMQYLAMAVPSVLVPEEMNLIINPLHSQFAKALSTIVSLGAFTAPKR